MVSLEIFILKGQKILNSFFIIELIQFALFGSPEGGVCQPRK
jgi:hypothetical protein